MLSMVEWFLLVSQDLALDRGAFDNINGFVWCGMGGILDGLYGMEVELEICVCIVWVRSDRGMILGAGST